MSSDAAWEQRLIETPALVATGRSCVLLYSGGRWDSAGYAVGYATCDSPLGPCNKATIHRPLLASSGDQAGPGGARVVAGPTGDQFRSHLLVPLSIAYPRGQPAREQPESAAGREGFWRYPSWKSPVRFDPVMRRSWR